MLRSDDRMKARSARYYASKSARGLLGISTEHQLAPVLGNIQTATVNTLLTFSGSDGRQIRDAAATLMHCIKNLRGRELFDIGEAFGGSFMRVVKCLSEIEKSDAPSVTLTESRAIKKVIDVVVRADRKRRDGDIRQSWAPLLLALANRGF